MNTSKRITIPGFEQLTQQQIFDIAVKHIGSTGVGSADKNGVCSYGGTGCNAAPLLTIDGRAIGDKHGSWPSLVERGYVSKHEQKFIIALQFAHDNTVSLTLNRNNPTENFRIRYSEQMQVLAKTYSLDTTELDKLGW